MQKLRRLTAVEFAALAPYLDKLSPDRREAARLALVENRTLSSVGEKFGWARQTVNGAVTAVWRIHEKNAASQAAASQASLLLPPGWVQVTLVAPAHMISKFRAEITQESNRTFAPPAADLRTRARKRVAELSSTPPKAGQVVAGKKASTPARTRISK